MIDYRITNHVTVDVPLVDGVEIETRAEREAGQKLCRDLMAHMDREMERVFYGGDPPKLPELPKP